MRTIAETKVQLNYNYNKVYFYGCLRFCYKHEIR